MRKDEWHAVCDRIAEIWPSRKRIPEATEEAWFRELGQRADREVTEAAISRLALETERAPGLASLSAAVRELGGTRKRPEDANEPVSADETARFEGLAQDWILINRCRWDKRIRDLLMGLIESDADPGDARIALLAEIDHHGVLPRVPRLVPNGEFSTLGEIWEAAT